MIRLIDANALKQADFQDFSNTDVFSAIDRMPTVDPTCALNDDYMHICRYCKWYVNEQCVNDRAFQEDELDFYEFWESGTLSEAIKEGMPQPEFEQVKQALFESKLSKKTAAEIMKLIFEDFEEWQNDAIEKIDESVANAINNMDVDIKVTPCNSDFYCKEWF